MNPQLKKILILDVGRQEGIPVPNRDRTHANVSSIIGTRGGLAGRNGVSFWNKACLQAVDLA